MKPMLALAGMAGCKSLEEFFLTYAKNLNMGWTYCTVNALYRVITSVNSYTAGSHFMMEDTTDESRCKKNNFYFGSLFLKTHMSTSAVMGARILALKVPFNAAAYYSVFLNDCTLGGIVGAEFGDGRDLKSFGYYSDVVFSEIEDKVTGAGNVMVTSVLFNGFQVIYS